MTPQEHAEAIMRATDEIVDAVAELIDAAESERRTDPEWRTGHGVSAAKSQLADALTKALTTAMIAAAGEG